MNLTWKTKALVGIFVVLLGMNLLSVGGQSSFEQLPNLPAMTKDEIQRIELSSATEKVILQRDDRGWRVTSPFEAKADRSRIKSLILNFRKPIQMDTLVDNDEEERYGLDAGKAIVVELWSEGEEPLASFLVGDDAAYGSSFVRLSGSEAIYRAKLGGRRRYALSANDWKSQNVLDFPRENFASLKIVPNVGPSYQIVRDNGWKIEPPLENPVDEDRIDQIVKSLSLLRIGERTKERTITSAATFELVLSTGDVVAFQSTQPEAGSALIQVQGESEIVRVASPLIERLLQGSSWFADRRMLNFNSREEIDLIRFYAPAVDIVLQQDLSTGFWAVIQPSNIDLDMRQIFFMVNTLSSLERTTDLSLAEQQSVQKEFEAVAASIDIRTLTGGLKTLQIKGRQTINGKVGYLCRDKQSGTIFLADEKDVETIVAGFGQGSFFENR